MKPSRIGPLPCSLFLLASLALLASLSAAESLPEGLYARLETNKGEIVLKLEYDQTPMTVANFVGLAEGTIINSAVPAGKPYFDGTVFHRVVPGHVIQAGKPAGTDLEGPGYEIPNEIVAGLGHGRAGMLGMANSGPHTAGSQFYITLGDRSYLDGDYTVFGEVITGMDTVNSIIQGDVVKKATIVRVGEKAKAFKSDEASFRRLVDLQSGLVIQREIDRAAKEAQIIRERWPAAAFIKPGLMSVVLSSGTGGPVAAGSTLTVRYSGQSLSGKRFVSMPNGNPGLGDAPAVFSFVAGRDSINPGLDLVLGMMSEGEKRTVILLAEMGYGRSGFYAQAEPGKARFVISPDTTLVYEVEVVSVAR